MKKSGRKKLNYDSQAFIEFDCTGVQIKCAIYYEVMFNHGPISCYLNMNGNQNIHDVKELYTYMNVY